MTDQSRADWARAKELLIQALDLTPGSRTAWLQRVCGDDQALQREVEALLRAHDEAGAFLESPALASREAAQVVVAATEPAAAPPARPSATLRFGAYRVLHELGRGGMGVVYLAARDDDRFEKLVAIKVISSVLVHPTWVERFDEERRILASLDHPNIARLIDAGTTDDGLPYVVMEYVEGEAIERYCATQRLTLRDRLRLFAVVCAAVQYSHRHLVVHRDIKTRNILVTPAGVPKLVDFGIAKLLQPGGIEGDATRTAFRVLTPESASPEQVRGEPVSVATDVYSLGVLLYRLLTGRSPYRGDMSTESGIARAICEEEPLRPSEAGEGRGDDEAPLGVDAGPRAWRELRGDLDLITLKALRKDPDRRYASVEQLEQDIERHLDRRPILAAPDAWLYRARKFTARHAVGVAAIAAVVVALVLGGTATWWQARRAERRFNDVRRLAGAVVGELYDAIADLPGSTAARKILVKRALEYLDRLAADGESDVALEEELADAYEKIGDVQGNPYSANLGDVAGARETYRKLLHVRQALHDRRPGDWPATEALSRAQQRIGDVDLAQGEYRDAVGAYRSAIGLVEQAGPELARGTGVAEQRARLYGRVGVALTWAGHRPEAMTALQRTIDIAAPLAGAAGASRSSRRALAMGHANLGDVFYFDGKADRALEHHQYAVEILRGLLAGTGLDVTPRRDVVMVLARVGADFMELQRYGDAVAASNEAIALQEQIVKADPQNVQFRFDLADMYGNLAGSYLKTGDQSRASSTIARALDTAADASARNPQYTAYRFNYSGLWINFSEIRMGQGDAAHAADGYRRALELLADPNVGARDPTRRSLTYADLGEALVHLARQEKSVARWREARDAFQHSVDDWNGLQAKGRLAPEQREKALAAAQGVAICDAALAGR